MSENRSLYDVIKENIRDGELPDHFSLPKEDDGDPNKIKWADGALDGVTVYHMGRQKVSDEQMQIIADAFSYLPDNKKAMAGMRGLFAKISPLCSIDAVQNHILDNTQTLSADKVHSFAMDCLFSPEVDIVKLGLLIIEIFNEPGEPVKDIIRTLGLSDEFTIFAVFNMMNWKNGNNEIFELAKKVRGWGRIHCIERLEPETEEIKDWLLAEGINNNILKEYSALDVYNKAGIAELLKGTITDEKLDQIARVLSSMFPEGPVRGISALSAEEADSMIGDLLRQAETHSPSSDICDLIISVSEYEGFEGFTDICNALLNSERFKELAEKAKQEDS
ncbi:MAG: hypothetical protein II664_05785 [Oscillospiraceae bacterium]|nr:hypothetical protein [Oscillospiraceae bacterium]